MNRSGTICVRDLNLSETRRKHNRQEITNSSTGKHESACSVSMVICYLVSQVYENNWGRIITRLKRDD